MFFIVAADQLHQFVRGRAESTVEAIDGASMQPDNSPLAGEVMDAPKGTRYQLLRTLRAMAHGDFMVVEHIIPQIAEHFVDERKREAWFRSLHNPAQWQETNEVAPLFVPGTAYPGVIGRILLRSGWCAPSDQPHWVPNLRFFFLTDIGRESFNRAQAWWSGLSPLERLQVMVLE